MEQSQYLISAGLIVSGLTSILQVSQIKIPYIGVTVGTGLISVMGTSFTFLPVAREAIAQVYMYVCVALVVPLQKIKERRAAVLNELSKLSRVFFSSCCTSQPPPLQLQQEISEDFFQCVMKYLIYIRGGGILISFPLSPSPRYSPHANASCGSDEDQG